MEWVNIYKERTYNRDWYLRFMCVFPEFFKKVIYSELPELSYMTPTMKMKTGPKGMEILAGGTCWNGGIHKVIQNLEKVLSCNNENCFTQL